MKSLTNENIQLGFTPCKTEQPLQGMELQEKETQKDSGTQEIYLERTYSQKMSFSWVSTMGPPHKATD